MKLSMSGWKLSIISFFSYLATGWQCKNINKFTKKVNVWITKRKNFTVILSYPKQNGQCPKPNNKKKQILARLGTKELLLSASGTVHRYSQSIAHCGESLKVKNRTTTSSRYSTLRYTPEELCISIPQRYSWIQMYCNTIPSSKWNQPKCPSI